MRTLPKTLLAERGRLESCSACPIAIFFAEFTSHIASGYVAHWLLLQYILRTVRSGLAYKDVLNICYSVRYVILSHHIQFKMLRATYASMLAM